MNFVWHLLSDTPWWVYIIFILLLNLGIKATKTQILSLRTIFILPTVFMLLSVHTLLSSVALNYINIGVWLGSTLGMALYAWLKIARANIKVDRENHLLRLPGSWSTLLGILIIFILKYYLGYQLAVKPMLLADPLFEIYLLVATGLTTGYFLGKFSGYLYRYAKGPSIDLTQL